jgi:hypothetical protein
MEPQNRIFDFIEKITTPETYEQHIEFVQFCFDTFNNSVTAIPVTYSAGDINSDAFQIYMRKNIWEKTLIEIEQQIKGPYANKDWPKTFITRGAAMRKVEIYRAVNDLLVTDSRDIYYTMLANKANEILEKIKGKEQCSQKAI